MSGSLIINKRELSNTELRQTKHKHGLLGSGYIRESISALYYEPNTDCNIIFATELIAIIVCYFDYILFDELQLQKKLQDTERGNEIYTKQLEYMQDHLVSLRPLVLDKENIIQNLILRYNLKTIISHPLLKYDLGSIAQTTKSSYSTNINTYLLTSFAATDPDEKIEITVQRFCLENFELRESVNELRNENFHLRNELYEQQETMNRQLLQIAKLTNSIKCVKAIKCVKFDNINITKEKAINIATKVDPTEYILDILATILEFKQLPQNDITHDKTLSKQLENILKKVESLQATSELNITQKIILSGGAHEIYRRQLKSFQDYLALLRSLIQSKENITENVMLRYELGCIMQDRNRQGANLVPGEIEMAELRQKSKALAEHTILENFEIREMVNELQDENAELRNEIYEHQYKINRQVLQINKLEKSLENSTDIDSNTAPKKQERKKT